jgi:hypothetical protein
MYSGKIAVPPGDGGLRTHYLFFIKKKTTVTDTETKMILEK